MGQCKKRQYLTSRINVVFQLVADISKDSEGQKKDPSVKLTDESLVVAGTAQLSNFVFDFNSVVKAHDLMNFDMHSR